MGGEPIAPQEQNSFIKNSDYFT
jgi:hypothetical protein